MSSIASPGIAASDYELTVGAHAAFFAALMGAKGPLLKGGGRPDGGVAQQEAVQSLREDAENLLEALDMALRRSQLEHFAPTLPYLITFFDMFGLFREAAATFESLLGVAQRSSDAALEIQARLGLARATNRRGDYVASEEHAASARELASAAGDARALLCSLNEQSISLLNRGIADRCRAVCAEALPIARELRDQALLADCLSHYGNAERSGGDCKSAEAHLAEALQLRRQLGDRRGQAGAMNNLAIVKRLQGDTERASALIGEALRILRDVHDRHSEALVLVNAGNTALNIHQFDDAGRHYRAAHATFQFLGNRHGVMLSATNLACIEMARHDWQAARAILDEALPLIQEVGDRQSLAAALSNLALCLNHLGDAPAGLRHLAESITIYSAIGKPHNAGLCCIWAADALLAQGGYAAAVQIIHGVVGDLERRESRFDGDERRTIEESRAAVAAALKAGRFTPAEFARWQADAEA